MRVDLTPSELASYAVAGGTAVLAISTWRSNVASRNASRAALAQSIATEEMVREIRTDRELGWQPILVATEIRRRKRYDEGYEVSATIANVGRGPALRCRYVTQYAGTWNMSPIFVLKAGKTLKNVTTSDEQSRVPWEVFAAPLTRPDGNGRLNHVLLCSDIFGNRCRFTGEINETSRRGDVNQPDWATWNGP